METKTNIELQGFTQLNRKEQNETYGGWAWLIALVPLLVQSLASAVGSFKAIGSTSGSIKGKDFDSHWDNKQAAPAKQDKVVYFAY